MIDQLRHPCRKSHFFARPVIELFKEGSLLSETITAALLRRAGFSPPHPSELQGTLIELLSNQELGF
jgi:hypothetical protein